MAGDDIVSDAKGQTTHAITIDAGAEEVWPWLVQMGYHRAGWYTYPWVDRYLWHIDNPSAAQIVPELQHLSLGETVPDGEPGTAFYRVEVLDVRRRLVLHSTLRRLATPIEVAAYLQVPVKTLYAWRY
jgi:hypothetical protein